MCKCILSYDNLINLIWEEEHFYLLLLCTSFHIERVPYAIMACSLCSQFTSFRKRKRQGGIILCYKEFVWSLFWAPGRETLNPWNFPTCVSFLLMMGSLDYTWVYTKEFINVGHLDGFRMGVGHVRKTMWWLDS